MRTDAQTRHRALDLALVLLTAPLTALLGGAGALAVLLVDGRPVLFRQVRCGRHGEEFVLLKLRTMVDAPGPDVTTVGDPRITRCGAVLRRTKLDELPQLWNVLRGEMSLVGPRPEVPGWVARHRLGFEPLLQVRPGVTAVSSIRYVDEAAVIAALVEAGAAAGPDDAYSRLLLPDKLRLEVAYDARRSIGSDLGVLLATLLAVALRRCPGRLLARLVGEPVASERPLQVVA